MPWSKEELRAYAKREGLTMSELGRRGAMKRAAMRRRPCTPTLMVAVALGMSSLSGARPIRGEPAKD